MHVGLAALVFGVVEPHDLDDVACNAAGVMASIGMARFRDGWVCGPGLPDRRR